MSPDRVAQAESEIMEVSDTEVLALIQEDRPLSEMLKELVCLRRWKEAQVQAQRQESQRMETMLTRLCVSTQ